MKLRLKEENAVKRNKIHIDEHNYLKPLITLIGRVIIYMLTSAPLRLVAEDRPTLSPSQHVRTTDGPARAWIRDRDTKTKKGKKDLHRDIKKFFFIINDSFCSNIRK
jgi:hypothetical protein